MSPRPLTSALFILLVIMFIILGYAEMRATEVPPEYKAAYPVSK